MNETNAPIPYAHGSRDTTGKNVLERPLPDSIETLKRYAAGDRAFAPPHWIRLRAPRDAAVGTRFLAALSALSPLVEASPRPDLKDAWEELELDASDPAVQRFAAGAIELGLAPGAVVPLFQAASQGRGPRFDALFARPEAPLSAHLLRLSALRDHGGMPWSDAFAEAAGKALVTLGHDASGWVIRLIAELASPKARRFLEMQLATLPDERQRAEVIRFLAQPPAPDEPPEHEPLPTSMETLELGAIDPRKPQRRLAYLGRMAELDWARARRLASSISSDDWALDETVGALLNHASHQVMADDFAARGLLPPGVVHPPDKPSARELLRRGGKVVRFDTISMDGIIDHDALAYMLAEATGDALAGVDFLEATDRDSLLLHAWDGPHHYQVELDTDRSIVDPYGVAGLVNVLLRERSRPERCLLAAEEKGMCDVVIGPEKALRGLVDAGLLWIRSGFKW